MLDEFNVFPVERRSLQQVNRDNAVQHGTHVTPHSSHDAPEFVCETCGKKFDSDEKREEHQDKAHPDAGQGGPAGTAGGFGRSK